MVDIEGKALGKSLPAQGRHHRAGQICPKAAAPVGQDHVDQIEDQNLGQKQPHTAPVDQLRQEPPQPNPVRQSLTEDLKHQRQQHQQQKHEGVAHADQPGTEPAPVLPDPVDPVQPRQEPVNPPAGGPQSRQGGNAHQPCGGIVVGADDQTLRRPHQGPGQDALQKPDQIHRRQGRVAQGGQHQQQGRKYGDGQKVAGIGGIDGNLQFRKFLQPLCPSFPHDKPPLSSG